MARGPGALKRQKELARLEWQREKAEKRKQRKAEKLNPRPDPEQEPQQEGERVDAEGRSQDMT